MIMSDALQLFSPLAVLDLDLDTDIVEVLLLFALLLVLLVKFLVVLRLQKMQENTISALR